MTTTSSTAPSPTLSDRAPSTFLDTAWGRRTSRTPVWLMRQAGRYLPEYRDLKRRYDFYTMCSEPELAAEVTLQPVRRYGVDAAVIFTDIMIPALTMGIPVDFTPGPVIEPIRTAQQLDTLHVPDVDEVVPALAQAIALCSSEASVPVIGHVGGPLTFAAYVVSGQKSPDHRAFRTWIAANPALAHRLLQMVTDTLVNSLRSQIRAGADFVQIFDSWVGLHDLAIYGEFGEPYVRRLLTEIEDEGVPRAYYAPDAVHLFPLMQTLPFEVVGVDWRASIAGSRATFGQRAVQGNLDPAVLLADRDTVAAAVTRCLRQGTSGPHIMNLGQGVLPETPHDNVAVLVETVKSFNPALETEEM